MNIIIANIIDFLAAMVQISSGALGKKKSILIVQTIQIGMQTISMFLLGAVTGGISNILSCIRNIICYKEKLTWPIKIGLIVVSGVLTICFNTQGLLGYLPFAVCGIYVILMDIKNPIGFKLLVTLSYLPWIPYYIIIQSYTGALFAAATFITNTISLIIMICRHKAGESTGNSLPEEDLSQN